MKALKILLKITGWTLGILLLLCLVFGIYVYNIATFPHPQVQRNDSMENLERTALNDSTFAIGNNWLTKNEFGHYVMYTEGSAYERGLANGKLSRELISRQEEAFTHQIKKMIPSEKYLGFLKYITGFINRGLPENVTEEYKEEIYGIALASSDSFDWIGDKYTRQMHYHAAHDIGHALQNMMLVGCTSFGVWGKSTANGEMIVGRNFDFWVGDEFAEHKIISFVKPEHGYPFAFITWGAFTGVSSGMNAKGLTVTINAAKSSIPFNAATPVSLVAREILQYAATIDEAVAIARKRTMFVSESFLVSAAADGKAVVIEKTPSELDIYDAYKDRILCANHFQGPILGNESLNLEQKATSASVYRYSRLEQLMPDTVALTVTDAAGILRDTRGINNTEIGLGNEKALNQLIAHHSVIFKPESLLMWVSTEPWQLGTYVCYDLRKVFSGDFRPGDTIVRYALNIPADTAFINSLAFRNFLKYREQKEIFVYGNRAAFDPVSSIRYNPYFYDAYRMAGDYFLERKEYDKAARYYKEALDREVATEGEQKNIQKRLNKALRKGT